MLRSHARDARVYRVAVPTLLAAGLMGALWTAQGAGVGPRPVGAPADTTGNLAARGAVLYRQDCAGCHGRDGRGTRARRNQPEIPDFTSPAWQQQHNDAQLRATLRDGKGNGMPAFGDRFNAARIRELIAHLRTFGPQQPVRASDPPGDFERQFRALQEQMSALRREFAEISAQASRDRVATQRRSGERPGMGSGMGSGVGAEP